jgi:hypothetical protein
MPLYHGTQKTNKQPVTLAVSTVVFKVTGGYITICNTISGILTIMNHCKTGEENQQELAFHLLSFFSTFLSFP